MSSSRILRGLAADQYRPFTFESFDDPDSSPAAGIPLPPAEFQEEVCKPAPENKTLAAPCDSSEVEDAFARGREQGLREGEEKLHGVLQALGGALEEISTLRKNIIRNSSQDMLHLVLTIVRQVLHCEVSVKPEIILSSIERALSASISADAYHVKVNPLDLELVKEKKPFFLARVTGLKNISFEGDDSIARGGCRVESELGEVDATLETQLDEIRRYLLASVTG